MFLVISLNISGRTSGRTLYCYQSNEGTIISLSFGSSVSHPKYIISSHSPLEGAFSSRD